MSTQSSTIVQRLWNYCNVLRDDGMSYSYYGRAASVGGWGSRVRCGGGSGPRGEAEAVCTEVRF